MHIIKLQINISMPPLKRPTEVSWQGWHLRICHVLCGSWERFRIRCKVSRFGYHSVQHLWSHPSTSFAQTNPSESCKAVWKFETGQWPSSTHFEWAVPCFTNLLLAYKISLIRFESMWINVALLRSISQLPRPRNIQCRGSSKISSQPWRPQKKNRVKTPGTHFCFDLFKICLRSV